MLSPALFYASLRAANIDFFTGVPDSLLKDFCAYVADHAAADANLIAANEGAAIALAAGHHLATGRCALVYLQNSGLGNALNPLVSLADSEVYSIPMLILVGWRGEPGKPDEPQHVKQGRTTRELLDCIGIPHEVLPTDADETRNLVLRATKYMHENQSPFAIVVSAGTFDKYAHVPVSSGFEMRREDAVRGVASKVGTSATIVATTGKTARELFEYRSEAGDGHASDFLTVGSMGHASQIAMAIALERRDRQVVCLDGDGALIMHMGSLAISGTNGTKNFKHIVVNNGAHDSVGGQPTAGHDINICEIARACCYLSAERIVEPGDLDEAIDRLLQTDGPALLEIVTNTGARSDLGRPTISPIENKLSFMRNLEE